MALERAQAGGEFAPQEGTGGSGEAIAERGAFSDCGLAGAGEFLKLLLRRCRRGDRIGAKPLGHARQHRGIDRIGLGERAGRLGEQPRTQRIGERDRQAGFMQPTMDGTVRISVCGRA